MASKAKKEDTTKTAKSHLKRNVSVIILILVIFGAILFYNEYLSGGIINAASSLSKNPEGIGTIITQKIAAASQIKIAYVGLVSGYVYPPPPANDPYISIPFAMNFSKYGNDERVSVSMSDAQLLGISNFSAVGISVNNGTKVYSCYDINETGFKCFETTGNVFQVASKLSSMLNLSGTTKFNVTGAFPSSYSGEPCWSVSGNGTILGNSVLFRGNSSYLDLNACLSPDYYVPVYVNATLVPSGAAPINILIKEVALSNETSQSQVTSLPTPISNST
jgi:hypothetical protein